MNGLVSAAQRVESNLKTLAHRRARAVRDAVQRRVRVDTGKMRDAVVIVDNSANREFRVEPADIPGRNPMVPVWHEFGTSKMAARPAYGPAIDESRTAFLTEVDAMVTQEAEEALR